MGNASEASQSELIALFRGVRDRLNESTNAGPINLIFTRGGDDIQVNVEGEGGVVLRGSKTRGTDEIPTYRDAPINLLVTRGELRPKALDYTGWTLTGYDYDDTDPPSPPGDPDTSAPILPVYVEPDPRRLPLKFVGQTLDWFSSDQITQ